MRPFTPTQIKLLETFANQAVIAIENVRLFQELKEALEQQTATSEILGVIASSPTDIQPVLDTVAENAVRVCGAEDVLVWRLDGSSLRLVASAVHCHHKKLDLRGHSAAERFRASGDRSTDNPYPRSSAAELNFRISQA